MILCASIIGPYWENSIGDRWNYALNSSPVVSACWKSDLAQG